MLRTKKDFNGLSLIIENPAGTTRMGRGFKDWSSQMHFHYGYIPNTVGVDGDEIDVFFPPHKFWSTKAFVIHQRVRGKEEYDEDKIMLGFENKEEALKAYSLSYDDADLYMGPVTEWDVGELVEALKNSKGDPGKLDSSAKSKFVGSKFKSKPEAEAPGFGKAVEDLKLRDKSGCFQLGVEVMRYWRR